MQCEGLRIIVLRDGFHYGTDAVLLANFVEARGGGHIVELCSGTGAVSILLSAKTRARQITGIEIQDRLVEMANRSASLNRLEDRVRFVTGDIRDFTNVVCTRCDVNAGDIRNLKNILGAGSADAVAVNPPYLRPESGPGNPDMEVDIAKREVCCGLPDVMGAANWLLNPGGRFFIVHRPDRLADLFAAMRDVRIEPKEIQPAGGPAGLPPSLILVRGVKGASPGLRWLKQIVL